MRKGWLSDLKQDLIRTFGVDVDEMDDEELQEHVRTMSLGLFTEVAEMVETFRWKPWKATDHVSYAPEVESEAVDVLHFFGHLLNAAGINEDDLDAAFQKKRAENARRQREGYSYS